MKRIFWCVFPATVVLAQTNKLNAANFVPAQIPDSFFEKGAFEASFGSGAFFSPFLIDPGYPHVDYTLTEVQLGYMNTQIHGANFWRGNVETLVAVFGGGVFDGRGNYLAGGTAWLRYNFIPKNSLLVPFIQIGFGAAETDLDRRLEGENFNFNEGLGIGVRYFVKRNWSVNVECRYQHISNAGLSNVNNGVNAGGAVLSISYFF